VGNAVSISFLHLRSYGATDQYRFCCRVRVVLTVVSEPVPRIKTNCQVVASYLELTSGGGGRLRCLSHSRLMLWLPWFFGRVSRSGMKICKPASGVMRV
jgi:hypothetical protein